MKSTSASAEVSLFSPHGLTGSLLRRGVLRQLTQLKHGQLVVIEDGERHVFGSAGSALDRGDPDPRRGCVGPGGG